MEGGKLKRLWPRTLSEIEMPGGRPVRRLGSEPVSRRVGHADRWDEGFLRLPGARTQRPLSSIVDGLGIYYDATARSELEIILQEAAGRTTRSSPAPRPASPCCARRASASTTTPAAPNLATSSTGATRHAPSW